MVGTTLNHYRVIKAIGSGGMGEVYLAEALCFDHHTRAPDADRRD